MKGNRKSTIFGEFATKFVGEKKRNKKNILKKGSGPYYTISFFFFLLMIRTNEEKILEFAMDYSTNILVLHIYNRW